MAASERRAKIMRIIYLRGETTISALADELGVNVRTVLRDVEALIPYNPIYTERGRGGGVKLLKSYSSEYAIRRAQEKAVLEKIVEQAEQGLIGDFSEDELSVLKRMIKQVK